MNFNQHKPLIVHNIYRCFNSNNIPKDYFDEQELDETLTHSENISIVLSARGIRTRDEWRTELKRWREMEIEFNAEMVSQNS